MQQIDEISRLTGPWLLCDYPELLSVAPSDRQPVAPCPQADSVFVCIDDYTCQLLCAGAIWILRNVSPVNVHITVITDNIKKGNNYIPL